jgi:uncharacterized protein YheU (UPF0270 family)
MHGCALGGTTTEKCKQPPSANAIAATEENVVQRLNSSSPGERERKLEEKVEDVMRQLRRGEAKVVFDPATGTVDVVLARRDR